MDMEEVFKWCLELEALKNFMENDGKTEHVANVRVESVDYLLEACKQRGARCER